MGSGWGGDGLGCGRVGRRKGGDADGDRVGMGWAWGLGHWDVHNFPSISDNLCFFPVFCGVFVNSHNDLLISGICCCCFPMFSIICCSFPLVSMNCSVIFKKNPFELLI